MKRNSGVLFKARNLLPLAFGRFDARRSALRLTLLFAPWILLLALPQLRPFVLQNDFANITEWWSEQWSYYEEAEPSYYFNAPIINSPAAPDSYSTGRNIRAALPKNAPLETQFVASLAGGASEKKLSELSRRFPTATWLLAFRLKVAREHVLDNRTATPLENRAINLAFVYSNNPRTKRLRTMKSVPAEDLAPVYQLPNNNSSNFKLNTKAIKNALAIARKGRSAEPQNSFWDWQCARFLFTLRRDDEAFKTLREGARKNKYDSHLRGEFRARVVGTERRVRYSAYSILQGVDAPQTNIGWMSHVMGLAVVQAAEWEAQGDHARALALSDDIMRLSATMRDGAYLKTESLASCAFAAMSWAGTMRKVRFAEAQRADRALRGGTWLRVGARKFADYAKAHGQNESAARAVREAEIFVTTRETLEPRRSTQSWPNQWPGYAGANHVVFWSLVAALAAILWHGAVFVAFRIALFLVILPGGLKAAPVARDVARGLAFCFVTTFCLAACGLVMLAVQELSNSFSFAAMPSRNEELMVVFLVFAFVAPVFMGAAWCAGAAKHSQEKSLEPGQPDWRERTRAHWNGFLQSPLSYRAASVALAAMSWSLIVCATLGAMLLLYLTYAKETNAKFPIEIPVVGGVEYVIYAIAFPIVCAPVALLGWLIKWRWFGALPLRESAHAALANYRQIASWWMVLLGWLFLLITLSAYSLRSNIESQLLAFIERGEVASLMRVADARR